MVAADQAAAKLISITFSDMAEHFNQMNEPSELRRLGWCARLWYCFQPWNSPAEEGVKPAVSPLTSHMRLGVLMRFSIVVIALGVMTTMLSRHVYSIQCERHDEFEQAALELCRWSKIQTAPRGAIYDRKGNLLAGDIATSDVYVEAKRFSEHLDEVTAIIARNLHLDETALHERLLATVDYEAPVVLAAEVSGSFVNSNGLCAVPGVTVTQNFNAEEGQPVSYRVTFRPYALEETARRQSIQQLARIFQMHERVLKNKCEQAHARGREIAVATRVPREDAARMVQELKDFWKSVEGRKPLVGVQTKDSWRRIYPLDCELANLLGYVNDVEKEYQAVCGMPEGAMLPQIATQKVTVAQGMSGIESMMDSFLCPTYGKYTYKHYRGGRPVEEGVDYQVRPESGADVYLTIDEPIQQILEEELVALCEKHDPDHAYAIMMEPSTGAILAVAQYPQFNPNDRSTFAPESTRNHFIAMSYEPGSIMKPVSLSSVLESRQATLDTKIDCEKGLWYYCGIPLHDSHACGILTLAGVIQQSSNIGTAKFAVNLGGEAMYRHLRQFGLGERTGVGYYPDGQPPTVFRREDRGRFAEYRHWDKLSITRFPIGQGLRVTPMQILQMWSPLANHGVMMQPFIVDRVRYPDGRMECTVPRVKGRPLPPEVAEQMTEALKLVTKKDGTGKRAAIPDYEVAGKTGTAQLWINADKEKGILGHYSSTEYFASFVGFVPADQPRFLLLVSIDNPKKGAHSGGAAAAPVFQKIAARTLEYLQVPGDAESAQKHTIGSVHR